MSVVKATKYNRQIYRNWSLINPRIDEIVSPQLRHGENFESSAAFKRVALKISYLPLVDRNTEEMRCLTEMLRNGEGQPRAPQDWKPITDNYSNDILWHLNFIGLIRYEGSESGETLSVTKLGIEVVTIVSDRERVGADLKKRPKTVRTSTAILGHALTGSETTRTGKSSEAF